MGIWHQRISAGKNKNAVILNILIDLQLTQHIQLIQALFDLVTLKATLIIP